jgi:hypothetical protein
MAGDDESALLAALDQAVGHQPVQRLAQRRGAGGVVLSQRLDGQLGAGLQRPGQQVGAQLVVHAGGAGGGAVDGMGAETCGFGPWWAGMYTTPSIRQFVSEDLR